MTQLAFQGITKSFGAVRALRDVTFSVAEGETPTFESICGCPRRARARRPAESLEAMVRPFALSLALLLAASNQDRLGPGDSAPPPALVINDEEHGPPEPYPFGPHTYRVGVFTGEGITAGIAMR